MVVVDKFIIIKNIRISLENKGIGNISGNQGAKFLDNLQEAYLTQ